MIRTLRIASILPVLAVAGGCPLPSAPPSPAEQSEGELHLFMALDPDRETQILVVETTAPGDSLRDLGATLRIASPDETARVVDGRVDANTSPCIDRYGRLNGWYFRCVTFPGAAEPRADYTVTVTAEGFPAASASTTIPDAFEILELEARGDPPGTERLVAEWTESGDAAGYFVTVRPASSPECLQTSDCEQGWFLHTGETRVETTVPRDALPDHDGGWLLEIHALDEALLRHLTTGAGGMLFPVPPVQNVEGGVGAVGAWVSRSEQLR